MDPATGELFVAQFLSIKHPLAGNGSGETFDEMLVLADGAVLATVTVMDGDGDTVTSNAIAIGDKIAFQDDGPTLTITGATGTVSGLALVVDETDDAVGDRYNTEAESDRRRQSGRQWSGRGPRHASRPGSVPSLLAA